LQEKTFTAFESPRSTPSSTANIPEIRPVTIDKIFENVIGFCEKKLFDLNGIFDQ